MSLRKYVVANWKSYKNVAEARRWLDEFAELYVPTDGVEVIIAPTFLCLEQVSAHLHSLQLKNVALAAQDVSPFPKGAYTGAVAADLLKDMVDYVIVGHSERRRYFHETINDIGNKVLESTDSGLTPIVCVDKPYAMSQLTSLGDIDSDAVILAYAPVDALNFRIPHPPEKVAEDVSFITEVHPRWPVIYGGALNVDNAGRYASVTGVAGLFVGSASLEAKSFAAIYKAVTGH